MAQIHAYLMFDNNCREAMNFYKECLGGELFMRTMGEAPESAQMPGVPKDNILHAGLTKGNLMLMASDMMGADKLVRGNNVSLSLDCESEEELHTFFTKLSEGGQVTMPIGEQFWGDVFGMLTDKFGIHWMLSFAKNKKA
jgi:PhnB protein